MSEEGFTYVCSYCGHEWVESVGNVMSYYGRGTKVKCGKCGDSHVDKKSYKKIDQYSDERKKDPYVEGGD